jgi:hypothetical protein
VGGETAPAAADGSVNPDAQTATATAIAASGAALLEPPTERPPGLLARPAPIALNFSMFASYRDFA